MTLIQSIKSLTMSLMFSTFLNAQEHIIRITKLPENTLVGATLFLASENNGWNPADEHFKFTKGNDGYFSLKINDSSKSFEYKITLGSWEQSESDSNGNPIKNRIFTPDLAKSIIDLEIASWSKPAEKKHTATSNVKILSDNFSIPQLHTTRRIWLYLPPDYNTSHKRYPVIYMQDGQNLFDDFTSFSGEWSVDETMDEIFTKTGQSAIVIGIENGATERLAEYSPWPNTKYKTLGKGDRYVDFVVKTLKPYIDKTYRTQRQSSKTLIMGSSMGGLISLYAAVKYPNIFGKSAIFSPAFWFVSKDLKQYININTHNLKQSKFYFVAGKNEDKTMVEEIKAVDTLLLKKDVPESNITIKIDEDGTHSESYWKRELKQALVWLLH